MSDPTTEWITDDMVEALAVGVCYGGFLSHRPAGGDAVLYWAGVREEARAEYRHAAKELLARTAQGARLMPTYPNPRVIEAYMAKTRLSNATNAKAHYWAMREALPTIFGLFHAEHE
jgi:hypothetical protein